ncbi:helix-turn-helix domain-containing protein [Asticcacaulis taihuensis]|uniref:helix-turn-helix domain-containing protein n=1 Tax=Asticcacaulis taihuensis TaxID=260084 RepID=UPI0026EE98AA|nr:helix-turn-helix transcriptional regulator [Asticcacaulis taihuensis]
MSIADISSIDPVDKTVGANIRKRRKHLGLSQEALAKAIGLTFQQVQKYERGHNRVSASVLYKIVKAMRCLVSDLYEGCDDEDETTDQANDDAPAFSSWVDDARRIDDLNPNLIPQLAACTRSQLAIVHDLVRQFKPADRRAA